jgi:hypothetical protein
MTKGYYQTSGGKFYKVNEIPHSELIHVSRQHTGKRMFIPHPTMSKGSRDIEDEDIAMWDMHDYPNKKEFIFIVDGHDMTAYVENEDITHEASQSLVFNGLATKVPVCSKYGGIINTEDPYGYVEPGNVLSGEDLRPIKERKREI